MIIQIIAPDKTSPRKAMVIEKDQDITRLLDGILGMDGYDVIITVDENETSTINLMKQLKPDMIIMDTVTADDKDLHTIASLRKNSDIPIIILSSDTGAATLKAVLDQGADDYIVKPFAVNTFKARLNAKLRRWYQRHKELLPSQ